MDTEDSFQEESLINLQLVEFYKHNLEQFGDFYGFLTHCCTKMSSIEAYPLECDTSKYKPSLLAHEFYRFLKISEKNEDLKVYSILYSLARLFSGYKHWNKSLVLQNVRCFAVYLGLEEKSVEELEVISSQLDIDFSQVSLVYNDSWSVFELWSKLFKSIELRME